MLLIVMLSQLITYVLVHVQLWSIISAFLCSQGTPALHNLGRRHVATTYMI